jgi:uncharacterized protein YcfJ
VAYDVKYQIGDTTGEVRMDHDPGDTIRLTDGKVVIARAAAGSDASDTQ